MKYIFILCCSLLFSSMNADLVIEDLVTTYTITYDEAETLLHFFDYRKTCKQQMTQIRRSCTSLATIINDQGYITGCVIGVAYGAYALDVLNKTSVSSLYLVDPYVDYEDAIKRVLFSSFPKSQYWDVLYLFVKDGFADFDGRYTFLRLSSSPAADQFSSGSLDFVFFDAHHEQSDVSQDLDVWYDKVRSGGVLCGADYLWSRYPGVMNAVDSFFADKSLTVHVGDQTNRFWWVEKP